MKSKKIILKRIKISAKNKILRRKAGQDHFNVKERQKIKRGKRKARIFSKGYNKKIKKLIRH